jgi:hypothetical protein
LGGERERKGQQGSGEAGVHVEIRHPCRDE